VGHQDAVSSLAVCSLRFKGPGGEARPRADCWSRFINRRSRSGAGVDPEPGVDKVLDLLSGARAAPDDDQLRLPISSAAAGRMGRNFAKGRHIARH